MEETTIEIVTAAGRVAGAGTGSGPAGAAIVGALAGGVTAGTFAIINAQKEIDGDTESIKSVEEKNNNLAFLEENEHAILSVFGKNNEASGETSSGRNFLQALRRNQVRKLKSTVAPGSGPMTFHIDYRKEELGKNIEKSLKELEIR